MQSYARHRKKRQMSEINVVPYIDVMLVLLVIFMITAPLLTEGVNIELPQADSIPIESDDSVPFVVHVEADGAYFVNEDRDEPSTAKEIRLKAAAVLRHKPGTSFLVRGDRRAEYESVVHAMVALQQAGVANIGLVTETPEEN